MSVPKGVSFSVSVEAADITVPIEAITLPALAARSAQLVSDAEVAGIVAQLSQQDIDVLFALDDHFGQGPGHIAATLNIEIGEARASLQRLHREGLCDFGCLVLEDTGELRGKGYWIDSFGRRVRRFVEGQAV